MSLLRSVHRTEAVTFRREEIEMLAFYRHSQLKFPDMYAHFRHCMRQGICMSGTPKWDVS
jgi:hypothetical protein